MDYIIVCNANLSKSRYIGKMPDGVNQNNNIEAVKKDIMVLKKKIKELEEIIDENNSDEEFIKVSLPDKIIFTAGIY